MFGTLSSLIQCGVLVPAGPAFALYHGAPPEPLNLEVGFPMAAGVSKIKENSVSGVSEMLRASGAVDMTCWPKHGRSP